MNVGAKVNVSEGGVPSPDLPPTRCRHDWITVLVIVAMMAVTTAVVQTTRSTPAQASSLPSGVDYRCKWRYVYRSCLVLVQPGTVANTVKPWMDQYGGPFTGFFTGIGGVLCAPAGPYIAVLCMALTGSRGAEAVYAASKASEQHRCVIVRWAELPGIPYPLNASVKAYGQKQKWLLDYYTVDGRSWDYWRWGNPDSCATRNPCVSNPSRGGVCLEPL